MFHNGTLNKKINKLQERALRFFRNNNTSSLYKLFEKDDPLTIHHRNVLKLALEMYGVKHHIAPKLMCELFNETNVPYNQSQNVSLCLYDAKTVLYDTKTLSYFEPVIFNFICFEIKDCETEQMFHQNF